MPLTWDVTKIKDSERVTTHPDDPTRWHPITECLVWYCVFLGIYEINDKTLEEFYTRMVFHDKMRGPLMLVNGKPTSITLEQLYEHIGLHTNASSLSKSEFTQNLLREFRSDRRNEVKNFKLFRETEYHGAIATTKE